MSEAKHSKYSASNFESLMLCPGKIVMEQGAENRTSEYAAEGTVAHQVLTWALDQGTDASAFRGKVVEADGFTFTVDADMCEAVQVAIDYVRDVAGEDGALFTDIRVNYSEFLGVPKDEAWGTSDVIIAKGSELIVIDYKHGMGVEVSAEMNPQAMLYALGALSAYDGLVNDFETVRLVILQPRIKNAPSEWPMSVADLKAWADDAAVPAVQGCENATRTKAEAKETDHWFELFLEPGDKQCKFCNAKALCPKLRNEVTDVVYQAKPATPEEFESMTQTWILGEGTGEAWLSVYLAKVDLIEDWCKAVRVEAESRMLKGLRIPGYKLVPGKRGARQWADAAVAEETLKSMRLKIEDMYDLKLISPTTAEKLNKAGTIGPRQWPKLQELITQNEGKPHVAPDSDKRQAIEVKPAIDDFDNLDEPLA